VRAGEIVGIAAVEGAGHHALLRVLAGRGDATSGSLTRPAVVGFVPEDRHGEALLLDETLTENVALRGAGARAGRMPWSALRETAKAIVQQYDVDRV
jgi:general nucleoside transport system ATP-binding protein